MGATRAFTLLRRRRALSPRDRGDAPRAAVSRVGSSGALSAEREPGGDLARVSAPPRNQGCQRDTRGSRYSHSDIPVSESGEFLFGLYVYVDPKTRHKEDAPGDQADGILRSRPRRAALRGTGASPRDPAQPPAAATGLPPYLLIPEAAELLRTSPKAVYALVDRGQLPGVRRVGRRLLISRDELLVWLDERCAVSPKENRR